VCLLIKPKKLQTDSPRPASYDVSHERSNTETAGT